MYETESAFELDPEMYEYDDESCDDGETEWEMDGGAGLSEEDVEQLASELLDVESDEELELFLGGVFKAVKALSKSPVGNNAIGVLKKVGGKVLQAAGTAAGTALAGPAGAAAGGAAAKALGGALGLSSEMYDSDDMEFEAAKKIVQLSAQTARKTMKAPRHGDPRKAAQMAVIESAKAVAPGLIPVIKGASANRTRPPSRHKGHWGRKGRHIVLYNVYPSM